MADSTLSTVLYIDTDFGYLADNPVEPPLPIALVVMSELFNRCSATFFCRLSVLQTLNRDHIFIQPYISTGMQKKE